MNKRNEDEILNPVRDRNLFPQNQDMKKKMEMQSILHENTIIDPIVIETENSRERLKTFEDSQKIEK